VQKYIEDQKGHLLVCVNMGLILIWFVNKQGWRVWTGCICYAISPS